MILALTPAIALDSDGIAFLAGGTLSVNLFYNSSSGQYQLQDTLGDHNTGTFTVTQTPLPAALPLFATGIGGLGLLGWRRKREAQAVA